MEIYLRHEEHGVHVAYSEFEAAKCEESGWVRDPEYQKKPVQTEPKKRGRPRKAS